MKLTTPVICFLIAATALISCKKDSPSTNSNPKTTNPADTTATVITPPSLPANADVYFAGTAQSTNDITTYEACYWRNDTLTRLANSASTATGILINNKDVYVTGYMGYGSGQRATLWKNGVPTPLSGSSVTSAATGIIVNSNNDILVCGSTLDSKGSGEAAYWLNGQVNIIEPANDLVTGGQANAIAVNGVDIYMAGVSFNFQTGTESAAYWKNGVMTTLAGNQSVAFGIAVSGSDVYVTGVANGVATVWKNGVATMLDSTPYGNSEAQIITISGQDVYIAGFVGEIPTVWKNGVKTILPDTQPMPPEVIGMAVNGSDVYMADGVNSAGNSIFWINGKSAPLIKGLCTVRAITVVPH